MDKVQVLFLCPRAPFAKQKIGKTMYQAKAGVLTLDDPAAVTEFRKMLRDPRRSDLRQIYREVDLVSAAAQVKKHRESQHNAAVSGVVTTGSSAQARLRREKQAQMAENLTGKINPQNTATVDNSPKDVKENAPVDETKTDTVSAKHPPEAATAPLSPFAQRIHDAKAKK